MQLTPLNFGGITIENPVLLAPMAGYTDANFRSLCLEQGAGAVFTELTSAEGLRRNSVRTQELLIPSANEHPIGGHIFGVDPQAMADAAQYIEAQGCFDFVDINCGCPVKKVAGRGAGAALTKDPSQIEAIVKAIKKVVSLPVTVKTRIGWNHTTAPARDIATAVEQGGADLLSVHGRFASKIHGGPVNYELMREMNDAISIPMIGNGGLEGIESAEEMLQKTGVAGLMIGRAAMGNPWIFRQLREPGFAPTLDDRRAMLMRHLLGLGERCAENATHDHSRKLTISPETMACKIFRPHLVKYLTGLRGRRAIMAELNLVTSFGAVMALADQVFDKNREGEE